MPSIQKKQFSKAIQGSTRRREEGKGKEKTQALSLLATKALREPGFVFFFFSS